MADTRYRVLAASIMLHPRQMLAPEEVAGVRPAWSCPPEAEWLLREVRLTTGMLLPPNVNPVDVAQLLRSGLVEAVEL
ncbi:hypothetical protein [Kribbella lupini]|uniref:Uncharacterized protein n=1 Tax=Kribbella lupini TaxID=291602 RepID=A0ABN2C209_9ACTN